MTVLGVDEHERKITLGLLSDAVNSRYCLRRMDVVVTNFCQISLLDVQQDKRDVYHEYDDRATVRVSKVFH